MNSQIKGRVWKFGDDINTDIISPGEYMDASYEDIGKHAMERAYPGFADAIEKGDIIVAGSNFGCGSSREHAPLAIKACGVKCVIAPSFARIFYRNSINIGLPIMESAEAAAAIQAGDTVNVDFASGVITDETQGKSWQATPFPEFVDRIIEAGGLLNSLKARGVAK